DPGEVDAVLLGESLELPQACDVAGAVAAAAAPGALRDHQAQAVVLAQGLGVHPGELRRHRDHEHGRPVVQAVRAGHRRAPLGIRRWRSGRRGGPRRPGPGAGPQRAAASASPALGASSASAARRSSTALRASPSTRVGKTTWTVTWRSPVDFLVTRPLPRTLRVRPEGVPGGIFTETVPPSSSGTDTVVPSTASSKATGTVILRFAPSALHTGCSSTSRVSRRS